MVLRLVAFLVLWPAVALGQVPSAAAGFSPGVSYEKRHVDYEVARDGSFVKTTDTVRLILNDSGVRESAQATLHYSASLASAEVLLARVITPEGQEIDVPPSAMFDQEAYASQQAPTFSDYKVKTIVFPQVKPGARLLLRTRLTQRQPILPGEFSAFEFVSPHSPRSEFQFTVTAPKGMPLHVQAIELAGERSELADGRVRHVYRGATALAVPPDPGSVDRRDYSPRVVISSMASGTDLARAYRALVPDATRPTPAVSALAERLTRGITDPRLQAKSLYDWVRLNVRYVNVVLERGGFVPRPLDSIVANSYGDCKDHATLLGALLKAKGLDSTPVLIQAGNAYWVPAPGALQAFNHMITYVPSLDLYLDATGRYTAFGALPPADAGKQVLHVATGAWAATPLGNDGRTLLRQHIEFADDGDAEARTSAQQTGAPAAFMRGLFAGYESIPDEQWTTSLMTNMGVQGEARLRRPELKAETPLAEVGFDYHARRMLDVPGPGALRIPPTAFGSLSGVANLIRPERRYPFACPTLSLREEIELRLPAAMRVVRMPPAESQTLDLRGAQIRYVSEARREGQSVFITREVLTDNAQAVCQPGGDADAARTFVDRLQRNLRAQLLYE